MDVPVDGDRIDVVAAIDQALVAQVAEDEQLGEGAERHQRHELALVDEHRQRALGRDRDRARRAELVADLDLARERRARRGQANGGRTYLRGPVISADVALLLGGLVAVPGGECAPDASSGLDAAGVTCSAAYGPGSAHGGVCSGADAALPAPAARARYVGGDVVHRLAKLVGADLVGPRRLVGGFGGLRLRLVGERRQLGERRADGERGGGGDDDDGKTHLDSSRTQAAGRSRPGAGTVRWAGTLPAAMSSAQSLWCSSAQPSST